MKKYIVCYSGGHSSAIVAVEAVRRYSAENVILLNHDICPRVEDADIKRFKKELADYLGLEITYANMDGWEEMDQFDIALKDRYLGGPAAGGAICTSRLKTRPFLEWITSHFPASKAAPCQDVVILYGFDPKETNRMRRRAAIMREMGYFVDFPLLWEDRTIQNIEEIGIQRPSTYALYKHANCKGCLKAGVMHWYVIYCTEPEIFEKAKATERVLGRTIIKDKPLAKLEVEKFGPMKCAGIIPAEMGSPHTFWAQVRRQLADYDANMPCECTE
jgi:hypothetical protein